MKFYKITTIILIILITTTCEDEPKKSGQVTFITGDVFISKPGKSGKDEKPLNLGQFINYSDQIRTGEQSSVEIQMKLHGLIRVSENTIFKLQELQNDKKVEIQIEKGKAGLFIDKLEKDKEILVRTPTIIAAVRGTKFLVTSDESQKSKIALFDGAIAMKGKNKEIVLDKPGEMILKKGQEPDSELIAPLSPESIADMKALEEMGNLDLQPEPGQKINTIKKPSMPKLP